MKRVLILAYDGLEHDLVVRWSLKPLMQVKYGVYEAPRSPRYGKPHTPSAWASFITGKPPEEHGVDDWWTYGKFLDKLRYLPIIRWIKGKRKILMRLGIKPRVVDKNVHRFPTIFDAIKPSKPLFVPTINEPSWIHEEYIKALNRSVKDYIAKIWEIHRYRKTVFFKELREDDSWKLFMVWFDIADLLGHICIEKCADELRKAYIDLAWIATVVKRMLNNDTFVLIVSDHGMKPMPDGTGDHSKHGFWSISHNIEWFRPRKITDFYNLIMKLVG